MLMDIGMIDVYSRCA